MLNCSVQCDDHLALRPATGMDDQHRRLPLKRTSPAHLPLKTRSYPFRASSMVHVESMIAFTLPVNQIPRSVFP